MFQRIAFISTQLRAAFGHGFNHLRLEADGIAPTLRRLWSQFGQRSALVFAHARYGAVHARQAVADQANISIQILREECAVLSAYGMAPLRRDLRSIVIKVSDAVKGWFRQLSKIAVDRIACGRPRLSSGIQTSVQVLRDDYDVVIEHGVAPIILDLQLLARTLRVQCGARANLLLTNALNELDSARRVLLTSTNPLIRVLWEDCSAVSQYGFRPAHAHVGATAGVVRQQMAKAPRWVSNKRATVLLGVVAAALSLVLQIYSQTSERNATRLATVLPMIDEVQGAELPLVTEAKKVSFLPHGEEIKTTAATGVAPRTIMLEPQTALSFDVEPSPTLLEQLQTQEGPLEILSGRETEESAAPVRSPLHEDVIREIESRMATADNETDRRLLSELAGHYRAIGAGLHWVDEAGLTVEGQALRRELETADSYGLDPSEFVLNAAQLANPDARLATIEVDLSYSAILYAQQARGWRIDPSQLSLWIDQRPRSFYVSDMFRAMNIQGGAVNGLRSFHPRHEQFERLRQAYLAERSAIRQPRQAKHSRYEKPARLQKLLVNMERWRWMPDDLGDLHIWNNLPAFETQVVKKDQVVHQERIIIGKESTQTPVFSDEMAYIEFNPEWGVPESIKIRQLLPRLRGGDVGVLARRNMRIKFGDEIKNPSKFRWSKVDIRSIPIVQGPGAGNPLGRIKFMFPNHHSVYMHDTTEKHLFNSTERTYSHGCIRVRNPQSLAEVILAEVENWSPGEVQERLDRKDMNRIYLSRRIKVHNTYFTQWVAQDGALRDYTDIYGHDRRIADALAGIPTETIARRDPALALKQENERLRTQQVAVVARINSSIRRAKAGINAEANKTMVGFFGQPKAGSPEKGSNRKFRTPASPAPPASLLYFQIR